MRIDERWMHAIPHLETQEQRALVKSLQVSSLTAISAFSTETGPWNFGPFGVHGFHIHIGSRWRIHCFLDSSSHNVYGNKREYVIRFELYSCSGFQISHRCLS